MKRPTGFDRPRNTPVPGSKRAVPEPPAHVTEPLADLASEVDETRRPGGLCPTSARDGTALTEDGDRSLSSRPPSVVRLFARTAPRVRVGSGPEPEPEPDVGIRAAGRARRSAERVEIRRFTVHLRRRRRRFLLGAGIAVVVVGALIGVTYSPVMAVRTITVEGTQAVSKQDVLAALQPLMGVPLPLVSTDRIQRGLQAFPLIESFSAQAVPPSTLVVRLTERTAVGIVASGSSFDVVDAAGVKLSTTNKAAPGNPAITAAGGIQGPAFHSAAAVIVSLPAAVRSQVVAVAAPDPNAIELTLENGALVLWGDASQPELKAGVLTALITAAPLGTVHRYDVSAPNNPATS